jgi:hypothetical protein
MLPRRRLLAISMLMLFLGFSAVRAEESSFAPAFEADIVERIPPVEPGESIAEESMFDPADEAVVERGPKQARDAFDMGSRAPVRARVYWAPAADLVGQSGEFTVHGESLDLAAPLRLEPGNVWLATSSVHWLQLGSSGVFPATGMEIPSDLWRITAGVLHFRDLANGYQIGAIFNMGSASDEPFAAGRDLTANAIGFLNVPRGERDAWSFSLFYSPTSQLPFPIPGVAYLWRPDETLSAKIGIPLAIDYRPTPASSFRLSYTPLTNVEAIARHALSETWTAYGGYAIVNDTYWLAGRVDDDERLYFFDQRFTLGVERVLPLGLRLDFAAAYLFDRQLFLAESFTRDRRDEVDVEGGVQGTVSLSWSR